MGELIQIFIDNIMPIMVIAGLGYWVGNKFRLSPQPIGTLIFNILSPALVFISLYRSDLDGGEFLRLALATISFQVLISIVAYSVMRLQNASKVERANVMISSFCLNAGNFGLSLISFAFTPDVFSRAVVIMVSGTIVNYSLGVYIASAGRASPLEAASNVLRTPAIYAFVVAFALKGLGLMLPLSLERSVELLSEAAIPMMLLMLGLQLGQVSKRARPAYVGSGVAIKLLFAPVLAVGLALIFGLSGPGWTAFIVQMSMPTAVVTIIFATEFNLDRDLALNLIIATTLLSPIPLALLILLLR